MPTYHVILRARPGTITATGHWTDHDTAHRKYRAWIGQWGTDTATIELVAEDDDGTRRVLKTWPAEN